MKASAETERFEKKRQDVIDAASVLINELGVKGMTFVDVDQAAFAKQAEAAVLKNVSDDIRPIVQDLFNKKK